MKIAFSFAGQGAQYPGMCRDLYDAYPVVRDVFAEASDALGRDMAALCFESGADELNQTNNTQPAMVTVETAVYRLLTELAITPAYLTGFSLGECSALMAGGVVSAADGYKLVERRAALMQNAVPAGAGTMAAVIGLDAPAVERLCKEAGDGVWPANYNCPGQIVVSGTAQGVQAMTALAEAQGVRMMPLAVSIPSHCPLMRSAADEFGAFLTNLEFREPTIPIVTDGDAQVTGDPNALRDKLAKQLYQPIRYEQVLYTLRDCGVDTYIEIGPGKTLSGLVKRTLGNVRILRAENEKTLEALLKAVRDEEESAGNV